MGQDALSTESLLCMDILNDDIYEKRVKMNIVIIVKCK